MSDRLTVGTITPDQLDTLYRSVARGERAEAQVASALDWCDELDRVASGIHPEAKHPVAASLRARLTLGQPGEEQAAPVDWQAIAKRRERDLKAVGEARHRAEAAVARASALADRWQAAHGSSNALVRAAGAELRDELAGEVRDPCPYCENRQLIPRRQMIIHIREQHPGAVCDFPLGWRVAKAYTFDEHDPKCSYVQTRGGLLCDCHILLPEQADQPKEI